ncbi:MAG: transcription termination factor Rho [Planctomycetota bacterium]
MSQDSDRSSRRRSGGGRSRRSNNNSGDGSRSRRGGEGRSGGGGGGRSGGGGGGESRSGGGGGEGRSGGGGGGGRRSGGGGGRSGGGGGGDSRQSEGRSGRSRRRSGGGGRGGNNPRQDRQGGGNRRPNRGDRDQRRAPRPSGELARGILEVGAQGFGFLRDPHKSFRIQPTDIHVGKHLVQRYKLKTGHYVVGPTNLPQKGRGPSLADVKSVDGDPPTEIPRRPFYKDMTSIDPDRRFPLGGVSGDISMRLIDLIAPIGHGQRALIVAPPRTGKTVILQKIAQSIIADDEENAVIVLLVDERPEEVTDWKRNVRAEVYSSSSDETAKNHVRVSEMSLQRCHRLLEAGRDVVLLLDSLTRLGRAYNLETQHSGRTLSGGVDAKTLEKPKGIFGAARNTEEGGSLTIVATALIETGSRMDEVIFEEFKGTGNSEVVLSRSLADMREYPAIDVSLSGTRKEEKLYDAKELSQIWKLRKVLTNVKAIEGMQILKERLKSFDCSSHLHVCESDTACLGSFIHFFH